MAKVRVVAFKDIDGANGVLCGRVLGYVTDSPSFTFPPEKEEDVIEAATSMIDGFNAAVEQLGVMAPLFMPFHTIKEGKVEHFVDETTQCIYFDAELDIPGYERVDDNIKVIVDSE